jgi:hypothetical protein
MATSVDIAVQGRGVGKLNYSQGRRKAAVADECAYCIGRSGRT